MKKNKKNGFISNNIRGLKLIGGIEPVRLFVYSLFSFLHGISWMLQLVFMRKFFDSAEMLAINKISLISSIIFLLLMGLSYMFSQIMNGLANCYGQIFNMVIGKHMNKLIFGKIDSLSLIEFENTDRLNAINKATIGSESVFWVSLTLIDFLFYYLTYFIFMSWYLFSLKPILGLSIIIIFIPCVLSRIIHHKTNKVLEDSSAPIRRENEEYENCIIKSEYFKETRLLGANEFFMQLFLSTYRRLNKLIFKTQLKKI